jgi:type VI secretion system lysozyme-like protein
MIDSREPRSIHGAKALVFDRLTEEGNGPDPIPSRYRVLDIESLKSSVVQEVAKLLSTRCHNRSGESEIRETSILDYGIPDFSPLNAASEEDLTTLARLITAKIQHFEPRLQEVQVKLLPHPTNARASIGTISAKLILDRISEPVSFPLRIDTGRHHATLE